MQHTDTLLAIATTAGTGAIFAPEADVITKVLLPIISGVVAPLLKEFVIYLHLKNKERRDRRKAKKETTTEAQKEKK